MKRFMLFAGIYNNRDGGACDFQQAFDSEHDARTYYDIDQLKEFEWAHVYDCEIQRIISQMRWEHYKPCWSSIDNYDKGHPTATFVKRLNNWQNLYKLSPPYYGTEYVVVSTSYVLFGGAETSIFAADVDGNILSDHQLPGSFRGWHDVSEALTGLGYIIKGE